jgi:hypothetical protein
MPKTDQRAKALTTAGKMKTAGRMNVIYYDAIGRSRAATVLGGGTASGLKLRVQSGTTDLIIDNVPLANSKRQPGTYDHRGI